MNIPRFLRLAVFLLPILAQAALAQPSPTPAGREIPAPLRPWESWATWDDPHRFCPTPYNSADSHICFWPSRLALQVEKASGRFEVNVSVYGETWVPLPGGRDVWPFEVKVGGVAVPVLEHNGAPSVRLTAGTHRIDGIFRWNEIPQGITLPKEFGILSLTLEGKPVEAPAWDAAGYLWLKRDASTEEADKDFLSVKVYALVEDGIPMWLRTRVEIIVSGKSREEDLGSILPDGWELSEVESPIPVMVDDAGRMRAQVRTGKWTINAAAFRIDNPKQFSFSPEAKPAAAEELIAFRSKPDFRMVEITGSPSIDVSQTTFPEDWREYPVYRWDTATPFLMEERMRGMGSQTPKGLSISRILWLDENGRGMIFRDHITGTMQEVWRLDAAEGQDLGSVRSNGQGQLITRNPKNSAPGVEVRTRNLNLEATGRTERSGSLSASGWRADADSLEVLLNLPPGWRLFALFGADKVDGDWLTAWTLLDLFLLLIFTLAVFRIWGLVPSIVAFLAFALSYHEPGAPRVIWIALIIPLALLRVVPEGWGKRIVQVWKWATLVIFVLILAPFLSKQVQQALFPQLEVLPYQNISLTADFETGPVAQTAASVPDGGTARIHRLLDEVVLPRIDFEDAPLEECVNMLQARSNGVPIVLRLPPGSPERNARITLALTDIPLRAAIDYVAKAANLKLKVEANAVALVLLSTPTDVLLTKEYRVPPGFMSEQAGAQDFLEKSGVMFPPGAFATYTPGSSRLIVRNTQANIDLIDMLTDSALAIPADAETVAKLQEQETLIDPRRGRAASAPSSWQAPDVASSAYSPAGKSNLLYDTKARIQTGPGVPDWTWRKVSYRWNGPVTENQKVQPILISVGLERILTVLRIFLLLALAAMLLKTKLVAGKLTGTAAKTAAILAILGLSFASGHAQEIPDQQTLSTLRKRLLEPSDAFPNAANISSVALTIRGNRISMDAEIHAAVEVAVPLPGRLPSWSPLSISVDGKAETALRRDGSYLWVVVPAGVHRVQTEGLLPNATEWDWTYQLKPRRVTIDAPEWNVSGLRADGVPDQQIFFALKQKATQGQASYDRQDYQSLVVVERQIELGLVWQVQTVVSRLSPGGKAVALRVPLLPGENVVTSNAVVKDGYIEVRLGAQDSAFVWESEIGVKDQLKLETKKDDSWVERWSLVASPIWNVTISGLTPVFSPRNTALVPEWHPWPGESVSLAISRPEAIAGATVTVNNATQTITLGSRQRVSRLDLSLRCSLGDDFLVGLPSGAEVTSLKFNGTSMPVRKDGDRVIIPLRPGDQTISLDWKENMPLGFHARASRVQLPVASANITTIINVPGDRWVLWTHGPLRGPAVRFWTVLVCCLIAAWILGRMKLSPLRPAEWMLLAIGLTQVPLPVALIVVGWLFLLGWRGRESFLGLPNAAFNLLQVLIIGVTAISLVIFIAVVGEGLLGAPEMFITGNGSSPSSLNWYQPGSPNILPEPGSFSVSKWWFQILMLVWALWLAASLIRWLRWAWQQFCTGGCFRRAKKKAATPPPLNLG